jgi:hypothetical protein
MAFFNSREDSEIMEIKGKLFMVVTLLIMV